MGMLQGKRALITGVASNRSIAAGDDNEVSPVLPKAFGVSLFVGRTVDDFVPGITQSPGDDLGAAIVTVEARFGDEDASWHSGGQG